MLKDHAQLKKASEGEEVALRTIDEEAKADHYRHAACAEYRATVTVAIKGCNVDDTDDEDDGRWKVYKERQSSATR